MYIYIIYYVLLTILHHDPSVIHSFMHKAQNLELSFRKSAGLKNQKNAWLQMYKSISYSDLYQLKCTFKNV